MRVLVAGGCGFIGHRVSCALRDAGHEVRVVDSMTDYGLYETREHARRVQMRLSLMKGIEIDRLDFGDSAGINDLMSRFRPECVVHLGNVPVASFASERPAQAAEAIVGSTMSLLEGARRFEVRRFVYVSSSMVYGNFTKDPIDEDHLCAPVEAYGSLKLSCERLVRTFSESVGFEHSIVRPSAVYGPTGNETFVISRFLRAARSSGVIRVFGAETKLDFSFVDDVADGIRLAATSEKAKGETFNIARGEARGLLEAANWIASRIPGSRISLEPPDFSSPQRGTMGIGKARALLGFDPKISMEEGLDVVIGYGSSSIPRD